MKKNLTLSPHIHLYTQKIYMTKKEQNDFFYFHLYLLFHENEMVLFKKTNKYEPKVEDFNMLQLL